MQEKYVAIKEFTIGGRQMPPGTEIILFRGFAYMNGYRLAPSWYEDARNLTESDCFVRSEISKDKI